MLNLHTANWRNDINLKAFCNITFMKSNWDYISEWCNLAKKKKKNKPDFPPFGSQERENSEIYFLFKFRGILCENDSYLLHLFHPLPFTKTIESFCAVVSIQNGSRCLSSYAGLPVRSFFSCCCLEAALVWPVHGENMLQDLSAITVKMPYKNSVYFK